MKRELKVSLTTLANVKAFKVEEPFPMKRELKAQRLHS